MRLKSCIAAYLTTIRRNLLNWKKFERTMMWQERFTIFERKRDFLREHLPKLVGTTASVICRLEDADYEGHSLAMLNRIAAALDKRVEIRFLPIKGISHSKPAYAS